MSAAKYLVQVRGVDRAIILREWSVPLARCATCGGSAGDHGGFGTLSEAAGFAHEVQRATDMAVRILCPDGTVRRVAGQRLTLGSGTPGADGALPWVFPEGAET